MKCAQDADETAWLESMAELIARKQHADLDQMEMKLNKFPKECQWDVDDC